MPSDFDASEFVDDDLQVARKKAAGGAVNPFAAEADPAGRAPTREEVDVRVSEMHQKLTELKRTQQELERERAGLEELRRRQLECTTGRQEMEQHLTRGIGLLEEAEFAARRDAEQMAKALVELREALLKVQGIQDQDWTKDNLNVELTRALTILENARMEWNAARLKFPRLNGPVAVEGPTAAVTNSPGPTLFSQQNYAELCKLGLAMTWPLAVVVLAIFIVLLLR